MYKVYIDPVDTEYPYLVLDPAKRVYTWLSTAEIKEDVKAYYDRDAVPDDDAMYSDETEIEDFPYKFITDIHDLNELRMWVLLTAGE